MKLRALAILSISSVLPTALWPRSVAAACSMTDVSGCVDEAQYSVFYGMAKALWSIDQMLLQLAYQLDHLRWWMVTQAFTSAYTAMRSVAEPLLTPVGMLAVVVGMLLFLLVPLFGRVEIVNIRQALIWLVVAPLLLAEAGVWFLQLEELRSDVGGVLVGQVGSLSAEGMFGATADDPENPMRAPQPLYTASGGGSACASGSVARPPRLGTSNAPPTLRMDDLAAALLLANAQDIHCPSEAAPTSDLPDGFFEQNGVFATETNDFRGMDAAARALAIRHIQNGITRLLLGMVACILAVLETLIQLVFSLTLVLLWLSLPLLAVLLLFASSLRPLGAVLQRVVSVVVTSWIVSLLLGLLAACLSGAAATGNPTAVIALSGGGVLLASRLLMVSLATLSESLTGLGGLLGGAVGGMVVGASAGVAGLTQRAVRQTMRVGGGALEGASSVGAGALGAAATAAMAARQTGNTRYALATAAGRIRPIAQVGAVAAGMGLIDEQLGAGLYAGERAARSGLSAFARTLKSDARRPLSDGTTIDQRGTANQQGAAHRPGHRQSLTQQPTLLKRAESTVDNLLVGMAPGDDLSATGDALIGGIQQARAGIAQGAVQRSDVTGPLAITSTRVGEPLITGGIEGVPAQDTGAQPNRPEGEQGKAVRRVPGSQDVQWLPRQMPPSDARTRAAARLNREQLLQDGFTLQDNPETVTFWKEPTEAASDQTNSYSGARQRALRRAGALEGAALVVAPSNRLAPAAETLTAAIPAPVGEPVVSLPGATSVPSADMPALVSGWRARRRTVPIIAADSLDEPGPMPTGEVMQTAISLPIDPAAPEVSPSAAPAVRSTPVPVASTTIVPASASSMPTTAANIRVVPVTAHAPAQPVGVPAAPAAAAPTQAPDAVAVALAAEGPVIPPSAAPAAIAPEHPTPSPTVRKPVGPEAPSAPRRARRNRP